MQAFTVNFAYADYCGSAQITVPIDTRMDDVLYNNEEFRQQKEHQFQGCGISTLLKAELVPPLSSSSFASPTKSQFCQFGGKTLYSPLEGKDCLHSTCKARRKHSRTDWFYVYNKRKCEAERYRSTPQSRSEPTNSNCK